MNSSPSRTSTACLPYRSHSAVISKQSGVAEVMKGALKADFWDVNKMAEHIVHLCTDEELYRKVVEQSTEDIKASTWDAAADKVIRVYEHVLNR